MDGRRPGNCHVGPAVAPAWGSQPEEETVPSFSLVADVKWGDFPVYDL